MHRRCRCRRRCCRPLTVEREAVEATRRRAALLLADPVVLRAVARALEPLRASGTTARGSRGARTSGTARRSPCSMPVQIERRARRPSSAFGRSAFGYGYDVGPRRGDVERRLRCRSYVCDVGVDDADVDLAAEAAPRRAARGTRATRRRTRRGRSRSPTRIAAVEELAPGDAELLLVDRLVLDDVVAAAAPARRRPPDRARASRRPGSRASSASLLDRRRSPSGSASRLDGASRSRFARLAAQASRRRRAARPVASEDDDREHERRTTMRDDDDATTSAPTARRRCRRSRGTRS